MRSEGKVFPLVRQTSLQTLRYGFDVNLKSGVTKTPLLWHTPPRTSAHTHRVNIPSHTLLVVRLLPFVMLINAYWQMLRRSRPCREQLNAEDRTLFCFFSHKYRGALHSSKPSISLLSSSNPLTPGSSPPETSFSLLLFQLPLSPNSSLSTLPSQFVVHIFTLSLLLLLPTTVHVFPPSQQPSLISSLPSLSTLQTFLSLFALQQAA